MNGFYNKTDRFRNFEFVVYPDSVEPDWIDYLRSLHIPIFISPLHDKDVWDKQDVRRRPDVVPGTPKKAHYHVMVMYSGKKSPNTVFKEVIQPIKGVGYVDHDFDPNPEIAGIVQDKCGMARYLCHMDEDHKFHYPINEVTMLSGADYDFTCNLPRDTVNVMNQLIDFINYNQVPSYAMLITYLRENRGDWLLVATTHTLFFTQFIKSAYWTDNNVDGNIDINDWTIPPT